MKVKKYLQVVSRDNIALCFRCEHRATFHETKRQPRCECGNVTVGVHSCYMFRPTIPPVMEADKGDKRPAFGPWMIAGRTHAVGLLEVKPALLVEGKQMAVIYKPCKVKRIRNSRFANRRTK